MCYTGSIKAEAVKMQMKNPLKKQGTSLVGVYSLILLLFSAATYFLTRSPELAVAEAAAAFVLYIINLLIDRSHQRALKRYIESVMYETEEAKNSTVMNFPLPMVTYMLDSNRIIWGNQEFFSICGKDRPYTGAYMQDLIPGFDGKWILEGKKRSPSLIEISEHRYQVHGNRIHNRDSDTPSAAMGITYWVDVTDYDKVREEYIASRPVVILILLDNYDELVKNANERLRVDLRNAVEDKLSQWLEGKRGLLRRYDRDRYMYICEKRHFDRMAAARFSIVDDVHAVVNSAGIHATVSVGAGIDGSSLEEIFHFAEMSLEMALSRGGDQAVVRDRLNFSFFGGRDSEIETRTKVKSRVVANALGSFIKDASTTYIMGHQYADMDVLGAAVGVCCIARNYGKRARIVMSDRPNACGSLITELKKHREYEDIFITPKEAMLQANSRSLLVVVDTNRPEQVEDSALLQTISRLVVIDHHRRAATYIDNAQLTFYEPYASSVCELMVELLEELGEQENILSYEADAMLAGIVTDTKNFTMRTGERTFDAAAFLRRTGADPVSVKRLLQYDFESTVARYSILEKAKVYRGNICIAPMDTPVDRVVASQAADELLNISGIEASIVLFPSGDGGVNLSARSIGSLNVQVLLEELGGGGNKSAAAAQLKNTTLEESLLKLRTAIDNYFS